MPRLRETQQKRSDEGTENCSAGTFATPAPRRNGGGLQSNLPRPFPYGFRSAFLSTSLAPAIAFIRSATARLCKM